MTLKVIFFLVFVRHLFVTANANAKNSSLYGKHLIITGLEVFQTKYWLCCLLYVVLHENLLVFYLPV